MTGLAKLRHPNRIRIPLKRYVSFYTNKLRNTLTCSPSTIALVGNSETAAGKASEIDAHDFVVRINRAMHYGRTGVKTDALAIINWSSPGCWMSNGETPINPDALASAKTIWLPMPPEEMESVRNDQPGDFPWPGYVDFTADVIDKLVNGRPFVRFPPMIWRDLTEGLRRLGAEHTKAASTGALILAYLVRAYPKSSISLYGFSYEGWPGHPWEQEKKWASSCSNVISR
ncbi:glycosyltransferase family 29 protein [Ochrobactrum sp. BTU1]|uniref:glycosyltransferase family 29 protein n=1 Tax=Ochrobactrum sp. BTU1 TaxID=2840456 RepID=UPI001C03B354|nr:glycosyltransferase family 29 protein [Ochrobactrum sp. BTU1]